MEAPLASGRRLLRAVTVGHLGIDVFNSMGPVLLAFLRAPLGLSAAQIGLAVGLHQFLAGATQPLFGWLVDRIGSRWVGPSSVLCTIGCICLAVALATQLGSFTLFLIPFALAALGSGAFHPQGTMHAATAIPGRAATTTSIFFLFGQLGLASGPPLAGLMLDRVGVSGIYLLGAAFSIVPLFMFVQMGSRRHNPPPAAVPEESSRPHGTSGSFRWPFAVLLALIFSCRAWAFIGTAAFLPLLFQTRGWSATGQGVLVGSFWLGGGIAGVLAGGWADRWGRRPVVFVTTLLGSVFLVFLPQFSGSLAVILALLSGAFLGAPHSTLMVVAQDLLPVRRGLSSGMALGFLFASGALSSWAIGLLADHFDLARVLSAGGAVGLAAALLAPMLPSSRPLELGAGGARATV